MGNYIGSAACSSLPKTESSKRPYFKEISKASTEVYWSKPVGEEQSANGFLWTDRSFVAAQDFFKDPVEGPAFLKEWEFKEQQLKEACPSCSDEEIALAAAEKGRLPLTDSEKIKRAEEWDNDPFRNSPVGKLCIPVTGQFARQVHVEGITIDTEMLYKVWIAQRVLENRRPGGRPRASIVPLGVRSFNGESSD